MNPAAGGPPGLGLLVPHKTRVHFVGIGGVGMSGIAEVLVNMDYRVTGSDVRPGPATRRLADLGAVVFEGHAARHVENADVVVSSTAVRPDNPEIREAAKRHLPIIPRAEMLAEMMRMKYAIAVAGSHGKTTTTSMIAVLLDHAGLDPTVVIGGRVEGLGGARLGGSELLVAEADESDRSFLRLLPVLAVITGIDREHLDAYEGMDDLSGAFLEFANKVPFYGCAVLCADDARLSELIPRVRRRQVTYGFSPDASVSATDAGVDGGGARYQLRVGGGDAGTVRLRVPGRTAMLNSLAAAAVGLEFGIGTRLIREGLEAFAGVDRRFQARGTVAGVRFVDDYAHHPTEIRATLETARAVFGGRIVAVFQPHRYSRVEDLRDRFFEAFGDADVVVVTDVYAAGEAPVEGASGSVLAEGVRAAGHPDVRFVGGLDDVPEALVPDLAAGDTVLTLGAGNITSLVERLKEALGAVVA